MLRQTAYMLNDPLAPPFDPPLYVPRYGFVARNQVSTPPRSNAGFNAKVTHVMMLAVRYTVYSMNKADVALCFILVATPIRD